MTLKLQYRKGEEDHGNGPIIHRWRPNGHTMAVACADSVIYYDKKGNVIDALTPTGKVVDIAWDKEGDVLAIAVANSGTILLWDVNSRNTDTVESGAASSKEMPTCLAWSPTSPHLVVGNNAGNMMVYNHRTSRRISLMGKHQRSVTQLKITPDDLIVSCSDDNTLSVTSMEGNTVSSSTCNGEPTNLGYGSVNRKGGNGIIMVSAVTNRKILLLAAINQLEDPVNLQFQEKYGSIHSYTWFNDGYILIGFDRGYIISISAHRNEIGSEINSFLEFRTQLAAIAVSSSFNKLLTLGDGMLKVRDLEDISNVSMMTEIDPNTYTKPPDLASIDITEDGQLVAVSSVVGVLSCFVTKMPSLAASYMTSVCYLTNLTQVTVVAEVDKKGATTLELGIEPTVMGLGPLNLAVANNNTVFFYEYHTPAQVQAAQQLQSTQSAVDKPTIVNAEPINRVEYLSTVTNIQLNSIFVAVHFGNRLRLHRIRNSEHSPSMEFPEENRNATLYSYALTDNFLIFTTSNNYIVYFSLMEWAIVSEYRHVVPIRSIFPHPTNVICCCFDDRLDAIIYSAVDDEVYKLPSVGSSAHYKGCLWETFVIDKNTFAVFDSQNIYVFLLTKQHIEGTPIVYVSPTRLPYGYTPLSVNKGIVTNLMANGKLTSILLDSHKTESQISDKSDGVVDDILKRSLLMHRWLTAWRVCNYTNSMNHWNQFAMATLLDSDVSLAIRIFRELGDAAMVSALEQIDNLEEKNLLHAQVYTILGRYDEAEPLYLESSQPMEALNMRRDLLNWPKALVLAEKMDVKEIPFLSKEYAQELELTGDHANALVNYEKGVIDDADTPELQEHNEICQSGIARMAIKTGDLRRGVQMAKQLEGRVVKKDCAIILEQMKQYTEAAQLYEVGLFYDRAAAVCLKANTYAKVGELLDKVKSPKIHIQYGKIMEKEKKWKVAVQCYEKGRDYDNQVRLLLDPLNDPDEAVRVVRESRSIEGAKLVAKFFVKLGDHNSAIQFLVMSQCVQEAFELAEKNNAFAEYAKAIEEHGNLTQALELADFYNNKANDAYMAAKFYTQAGQFEKAMGLLFKQGDSDDCVGLAVDCGVKANDEVLTGKLVRFLLGEDGNTKDPQHLFKLYVGLGRTRDAAKTAVVVAQIHQQKGSYRVARDLLFKMHQELRAKMMRIPLDMNKGLMAIHSYIIVKSLIARKETLLAARMLIRTCQEIQRFPTHIVQILTSAVVICSQANLKKSAHKYASQLMNQEYRPKIHEKYKKKIEDIVRKGASQNDIPEVQSPCPYCEYPTADYAISCDNCKMLIPYCIITGRHIVSEDFSRCPTCEMPAYYSEFRKLSQANDGCYMCGGELKMAIPEDAKAYLERMEKDYKM